MMMCGTVLPPTEFLGGATVTMVGWLLMGWETGFGRIGFW